MKKIIIVLLMSIISFSLSAHKHGHGVPAKTWELKEEGTVVQADFIKEMNGMVYLMDEHHAVLKFSLAAFSEKDQEYISSQSNWIQAANTVSEPTYSYLPNITRGVVLAGIFLVLFSVFRLVRRENNLPIVYGILGFALVVVATVNLVLMLYFIEIDH